jgi:1-acyl-sn-glycerol-3-phosphate acyltransferase
LSHIEKGQPYVYMANHQGAFDIFALLGYFPFHFKWVAREEIFSIPVLGWAMTAAGYISIDRRGRKKALASVERAASKIRAGVSVLVFPEGTRSPDGKIHDFKKGAFTLAVKAGVPIVPITIRGSRDVLPKSSLRVRPGTIEITIGEAIRTQDKRPADRSDLMRDVRTAMETRFAN